MIGVILFHLVVGKRKSESGAVGTELWSLGDRIRWRRAIVGKSSGYADATRPKFSTCPPFFWVVNSSMANVADLRSAVLVVWAKTVCTKGIVS